MKPWILIATAILVLFLATIGLVFSRRLSPRTGSTSWPSRPSGLASPAALQRGFQSRFSQQLSGRRCQGEGPVEFTHPPMKIEDIGVILPLGLVVDAHVTPVDHIYFSPKIFRSERDKYPVYAIADGTVVKISHRGIVVGDRGGGGKKSEYRLDVEYTCTFYSYYDLLTSLSPELAGQVNFDTSKPGDTAAVRIPIKAGQEIGRIGGQTLDWAVYNTAVQVKGLLVPEHYEREGWKIHTDPEQFKYFPQPLESRLTNLLARQAPPRVGKIDYDIDGKAVGNWFKEGTNGYAGITPQRYWDGHFSLVYDYIDPTQIRFSIGNFAGKSAQFGVKGNAPDPGTIDQAKGKVEYELVHYEHYNKDTRQSWQADAGPIANPGARNLEQVLGTALIQLMDDRKLKVEVFLGKTGSEVADFTPDATIYER